MTSSSAASFPHEPADWAKRSRRGSKLCGSIPPCATCADAGCCTVVQLRDAAAASDVVKRSLRAGVIFLQSGVEGDVVVLSPPLVIEEPQLGRALDTLEPRRRGDRGVTRYRIGIVGAGFGVTGHLPALVNHPHFEVVALASPSTAAKVAREKDVPHHFRSCAEMLAGCELDAVTVASPPFAHRDDVLAALAAKKHVLCEKPFALRLADAAAMVEASRGAGVACGVAHEFRFVPQVQALKELISTATSTIFATSRSRCCGTRCAGSSGVRAAGGSSARAAAAWRARSSRTSSTRRTG